MNKYTKELKKRDETIDRYELDKVVEPLMPLENDESNGNFHEPDDTSLWTYLAPLEDNHMIEPPGDSNDLNPGYGGYTTKPEVGSRSTKGIEIEHARVRVCVCE